MGCSTYVDRVRDCPLSKVIKILSLHQVVWRRELSNNLIRGVSSLAGDLVSKEIVVLEHQTHICLGLMMDV